MCALKNSNRKFVDAWPYHLFSCSAVAFLGHLFAVRHRLSSISLYSDNIPDRILQGDVTRPCVLPIYNNLAE